jgi:hypothetical protein
VAPAVEPQDDERMGIANSLVVILPEKRRIHLFPCEDCRRMGPAVEPQDDERMGIANSLVVILRESARSIFSPAP